MKNAKMKLIGKVVVRISCLILLCVLFHVLLNNTIDLGDVIVLFVLAVLYVINAIFKGKLNELG